MTLSSSIPLCAYHIVHRGYRRAALFVTDGEFVYYLGLLAKAACRMRVSIFAFCLMPNHVHLLLLAVLPETVDLLIRRVHLDFEAMLRTGKGQTKKVWSDNWLLKPLSFSELWTSTYYVELNPVSAGMVDRAEDYRWSSARTHITGSGYSFLDLALWQKVFGTVNWAQELWRRLEERSELKQLGAYRSVRPYRRTLSL